MYESHKKIFFTGVPFLGIRVSGKSARQFLQRLITVDMKHLSPNLASRGLLLQGNGKISAAFTLLCEKDDTFLLVAKIPIAQNLVIELEKLHFDEDLTITEQNGFGFFAFGKNAHQVFFHDDSLYSAVDFERMIHENYTVFPFKKSDTYTGYIWPVIDYKEGYDSFFLVSDNKKDDIQEHMSTRGGVLHNDTLFWEYQRMSILQPKFLKEWNFDSMPLNVGFYRWIHRNKGCYPGQEVIERTFNIGHPSSVLVLIDNISKQPAENSAVFIHDEEIGTLTSIAVDPISKKCLALGIIRWNYRFPQTEVKLSNGSTARILQYVYHQDV